MANTNMSYESRNFPDLEDTFSSGATHLVELRLPRFPVVRKWGSFLGPPEASRMTTIILSSPQHSRALAIIFQQIM